jgi:hypothetical protein
MEDRTKFDPKDFGFELPEGYEPPAPKPPKTFFGYSKKTFFLGVAGVFVFIMLVSAVFGG